MSARPRGAGNQKLKRSSKALRALFGSTCVLVCRSTVVRGAKNVQLFCSSFGDTRAVSVDWLHSNRLPVSNDTQLMQLCTPVPHRLQIDQVMKRDRASGRSWKALASAAAVIAFLVGGGAGWVARGAASVVPSNFEIFTAEALDAYKLYVVEVRHPVEVPGDERVHLTQWLSKRLGADLRVPDLQSLGLKLVGGRRSAVDGRMEPPSHE